MHDVSFLSSDGCLREGPPEKDLFSLYHPHKKKKISFVPLPFDRAWSEKFMVKISELLVQPLLSYGPNTDND